ncbi:MAG: nucleotide synthetase [Pseudomonadota bacterium]
MAFLSEQQRDWVYDQRRLGGRRPRDLSLKNALYLRLTMDMAKRGVQFRYAIDLETLGVADEPELKLDCYPRGEPKRKRPLDIDIKNDGWVYIELDPEIDWRWSAEFAAVTLKDKPCDALYGRLEYAERLEGPYRDKDKFPLDTELRVARFLARYNDGIVAEKTLRYCLNIDLAAPGSRAGWQPITIDPGVKNPGSGHS